MNCQNAQSMVLNFINNKLDKEETKEFIEHIRSCKDCWEELEIYYVMLIGLNCNRSYDSGNAYLDVCVSGFCDVSLNCKVWQSRGWKC